MTDHIIIYGFLKFFYIAHETAIRRNPATGSFVADREIV
jgi:hypothetical protein